MNQPHDLPTPPPPPPQPPPPPTIPKCDVSLSKVTKKDQNQGGKKRQKQLMFTLAQAITNDDTLKALQQLKQGVDINVCILYSKTPLSYSLELSREEIALLLLQHGAYPETLACVETSHNPMTPLHIAVENNCIEVVKKLLELEADVNSVDLYELTPLHYSSFYGHKEISKLLLDHGADVTSLDKTERTPFHRAIENCSLEVAEMLLKYGANINAKDVFFMTPLMFAAFVNDDAATKFLLSHQCDINATDMQTMNTNNTALHFACEKIFSVCSNFEDTYFHHFKESGDLKILTQREAYFQRAKVNVQYVDLLLNSGAYVGSGVEKFKSPLCFALMYLHTAEEKYTLIDKFLSSGLWMSSSLLKSWKPMNEIDFDNIETYQLLSEFYDHQVTLKYQCRRNIRMHLAHTRDIISSVDKLDLPSTLKNYLKLV